MNFDEQIKKRPISWLAGCCLVIISATFFITKAMLSDANESLNERIKIFEKSEKDLKEQATSLRNENKNLNEKVIRMENNLVKIQSDYAKLELDYNKLKDKKSVLVKNPPKTEQEERISDIKKRIQELTNQRNNCSVEKINGGDFLTCQNANEKVEERIDQYYKLLNSMN